MVHCNWPPIALSNGLFRGTGNSVGRRIPLSQLASLNLVGTTRAATRQVGIATSRQKLIDRLNDQIALARAQSTGDHYQRLRFRRMRSTDGEEIAEIPVKTRVRPWWNDDPDGSILLWIKYGNRTLELQKGKTAIRVPGRSDIVPTLETVKVAIRQGEFDPQITAAASAFRKRFGK